MVAPVPSPWMVIPMTAMSGCDATRPDGGHDPAGDKGGRRKADDTTPEAVGKPAAEHLPCDIGQCLEAEGGGGGLGRTPAVTAAGRNAWRTPSSKMPFAAAPATGSRTGAWIVRFTLRRRSVLPAGGDLVGCRDGAGSDVSCRPLARAAAPASASRRSLWPASRARRMSCRIGWVGAAPRRADPYRGTVPLPAGTTIAGPLVMIRTNTTPTSDAAMKTSAVDRQPAVSMRLAASGRAMATPSPGSGVAIPRASPDIPSYRRAIAVDVPMKASLEPDRHEPA